MQQKKVSMDKNTILIDGQKTYFCCTQKTNAPKVLLIHGYGGTHRGLVKLGENLRGYDVIFFDLPGHGFSDPLKKPHTIINYAAFLKNFIKELELEDAPIVGHSLGASIATVYAGKNPDLVSKLCLVNPVIANNNFVMQLAKLYYKTAELLPSDIGKRMFDNKFILFVTHELVMTERDPKKRRKILQDNYISYRRANLNALTKSYESYFTSKLLEYAEKITAKTLVIAGGKDIISPKESVQILAEKIPYHSLTLLPNEGHMGPVEMPHDIAKSIQSFLDQT